MPRPAAAIWKDLAYSLIPPLATRGLGAVRARLARDVGLPQRDLAELFPGIDRVDVSLPAGAIQAGPGLLPLRELAVLSAICRHAAPRATLEIGTFRGATTLALAMNCAPDALVYTLDLLPGTRPVHPLEIGSIAGREYEIGERFHGTQVEGRIRQLYGDSARFDFAPFTGACDLIFVDGNHEYENVLSDSRQAFRCLRPGGAIVWDDYHPEYGPGVMRALHELRHQGIQQIRGTRLAVLLDPRPRSGGSPHA